MPAAPKSDDQLPRNAIRLSDAFERYYRATAPDVSAVEAELNAALPGPESQGMWRCDFNWLGCLTDTDYYKAAWERWYRVYVAMEESRLRAEKSFRDALATGRPAALVRDPVSRENVELLNYRSWNEKPNFGVAGFIDDFVGPNELVQPGPNTIIDGATRPVFFDLDDFQSSFGLDQAKAVPVGMVEAARVEVIERWPIPECAPRGRVAHTSSAANFTSSTTRPARSFASDCSGYCQFPHGLAMARAHSREVFAMTNIDVQAGGRADDNGAISIKDFCRRNSIGTTTAYAEIAAGRLIARKCRSRTLIAIEDEKAWRANLPKLESAAA